MATDDANHNVKLPFVDLDMAEISALMAAHLTSTLVGHMLYMKGQIPFPVNSLERMSPRSYSGDLAPPYTKLTKKRKEFLDAYDDLLSHLRTTFVALSTAFANNPKFSSRRDSATAPSSSEEIESTMQQPNYRPAKVFLFLAMGSSLTLPKARLLLELDNFHVEKFGERVFMNRQIAQTSLLLTGEDVVEEAESDIDDASDTDTANDTEEDEFHSNRFFSVPSTPCRTASFYSASPGSEPPDSPSSRTSEFSEEAEHSSPETSLSMEESSNGCRRRHQFSFSIQDPSVTVSERVLSKALVQFGEELGFEQELAPTQTHILLLAPRRFSHPTWIPRQNLTPLLDKTMHSIIKGETIREKNQAKKFSGPFGSSVPAVGLRILCQSGSSTSDWNEEERESVDNNVQELDELIWWSWDGKLIGFSDG